jgi:tripartite-type tricarboxylate transporter receptor subunit TctC
MRRALVLALALGCTLAAVHAACAQTSGEDYPQHTVTFLCPFPAGGGTDMLTRLLAQELQEKLKRPVIVDNRPGAGTIVAAQAAARAAPDGHTIFLAPVTTLARGPSVHKSLPYDTVKDFAPIGLVGSSQFALVANLKVPADTLAELIAYMKSNDGKLSYASSGAATPHHLFMAMFLKMIGTSAQHVP